MGFIGNFADLSGYQTGCLVVQNMMGRDRFGLPRWELLCVQSGCLSRQIVDHRRLAAAVASGAALACTSGSCPSNRVKSESFTEFRRRERLEKEQAAKAAAHVAANAEREAAERRVKEERVAALRAEYRSFFMHQDSAYVAAGLTPNIMPFSRWTLLTDKDRNRLLEAIRQRPDVRVEIN